MESGEIPPLTDDVHHRHYQGSSVKRRSPPSPSSTLDEPHTKKSALCYPSSSACAASVVSDGTEKEAESDLTALSTPAELSPSGNVLNRSETISTSSPEAAGTLPPPLAPIPPEAEYTVPSKSSMLVSPPGSDRDSSGSRTSPDSRRLRRAREKMREINKLLLQTKEELDKKDRNQNTMDTNYPEEFSSGEETD